MFLSPKTVEYYPRHVYEKLGIGSGAELASVVMRRSTSAPELGKRLETCHSVFLTRTAKTGPDLHVWWS